MLSAIAARKARQNSSSKTPQTPQIPEKRPHSHPNFISSAKKQRKIALKRDITTTSSKEEDAILPNDSDDDSNMSITPEDQDIPQGYPIQPTKAWSPSRPILHSSDDASDVSEQPLPDFTNSFHQAHHLPTEELEILSTYRPVHEQNMFRLSIEESSALGLSGPALILVLSPFAKVSFVGTYRLRVLRGSISLLGTIIQPSHILHHVFAPRSSPIPVIEAHAAQGESSKSLSDIPAQILNSIAEDDVLIVLQELRTGIEGLGRVVRTFEGIFYQASPERTPDLPMEGVHLVSHSSNKNASFTHDI
jgi:polynucleotide 5'-hydroxyl-kinase GRC3/NOL9